MYHSRQVDRGTTERHKNAVRTTLILTAAFTNYRSIKSYQDLDFTSSNLLSIFAFPVFTFFIFMAE